MESEMQRAGRRALQAKGTAGAKALRQDSTGKLDKNGWPARAAGAQGARKEGGRQRLAGVRPAGPFGLYAGVLQDFKQREGLTRGIF